MASACCTPESWPLLLYTGTHGHYLHTPEFSLQASQSLLQHTGIIFSVTILFIMSGKSPFDKLNKTNYDDWKIQMEALLKEKGLFRVTCGHDVMPAIGPNSKGVRTFIEKQCLTHTKIILCINHPRSPTHDSDAIANAAEEEEEAIFTAVDEEDFSDEFW